MRSFFGQNIEISSPLAPARNPVADGQSKEKTEADERLWRETGRGGLGEGPGRAREEGEEGDRGPPWRKNGGAAAAAAGKIGG